MSLRIVLRKRSFACEYGFLLANQDFSSKIWFLAYRIRVFLAQTALPVRRASVHGLEIEIGSAGRD